MLVNCTDSNWTVMPEDVIAQLIMKKKLTTDGTNLMLEWMNK